MLALVNGMDAVKSPNLMDASSCQWNGCCELYKLTNLTACFGYPVLLSNGMDAVKSPNLMDDSSCQWNGCCEL